MDLAGLHPAIISRDHQFQVFVAAFDADIADLMISIKLAARFLLQPVAVGYFQNAPPYAARSLLVDFDFGPDYSLLSTGGY